jgi:hypothetical protein
MCTGSAAAAAADSSKAAGSCFRRRRSRCACRGCRQGRRVRVQLPTATAAAGTALAACGCSLERAACWSKRRRYSAVELDDACRTATLAKCNRMLALRQHGASWFQGVHDGNMALSTCCAAGAGAAGDVGARRVRRWPLQGGCSAEPCVGGVCGDALGQRPVCGPCSKGPAQHWALAPVPSSAAPSSLENL